MDGGNEVMTGPRLLTEGEWAGWHFWGDGDPFEHQSGPFFFREEADGTIRCAFRAEKKHMNGGGFMHGGCMMTFADYALFALAWKELNESYAVTVSLNSEFISSGAVGDLVEATGEVVKAGGSLIFVRGTLTTGGRALMTFSGVIKKVKPRR
ncbi:MAG TPA: PaaI family thioesterase [Caulobacteraceae bacterium]|nr:PaaI family thioesterase [Caulobacteraceae bacterium]